MECGANPQARVGAGFRSVDDDFGSLMYGGAPGGSGESERRTGGGREFAAGSAGKSGETRRPCRPQWAGLYGRAEFAGDVGGVQQGLPRISPRASLVELEVGVPPALAAMLPALGGHALARGHSVGVTGSLAWPMGAGELRG